MFTFLLGSRKQDGEEGEEYEYVTDEDIVESEEDEMISKDGESIESIDDDGIIEKIPDITQQEPTSHAQDGKDQNSCNEAHKDDFDKASSTQSELSKEKEIEVNNSTETTMYLQQPELDAEATKIGGKLFLQSALAGDSFFTNEEDSNIAEVDSSGVVASDRHDALSCFNETKKLRRQKKPKAEIQTENNDKGMKRAETDMFASVESEDTKSSKISVDHGADEEISTLVPNNQIGETLNTGEDQSSTKQQTSFTKNRTILVEDSTELEDNAAADQTKNALDEIGTDKNERKKESTQGSIKVEQPNSQSQASRTRRWSLLGAFGSADEERSAADVNSEQQEKSTALITNLGKKKQG
mmetsp:Transcript_31671/g.47861  ORF Transcript_31671/g.47861 Transcript_31671/m.47861 type:complete len:355 (+) Transcript_31671:184-1248(+)